MTFSPPNVRVGHPPSLYGFQSWRSLGEERFRTRERRLVRVFHRELAGHFGTTLVREPGRPKEQLPPRLRQTLDYLLEGESEKQAALRMGLSRHTVHEYVADRYRRPGVNSRAELMALCLGHHFRPQRQGGTPGHDPSLADFPVLGGSRLRSVALCASVRETLPSARVGPVPSSGAIESMARGG